MRFDLRAFVNRYPPAPTPSKPLTIVFICSSCGRLARTNKRPLADRINLWRIGINLIGICECTGQIKHFLEKTDHKMGSAVPVNRQFLLRLVCDGLTDRSACSVQQRPMLLDGIYRRPDIYQRGVATR